MPIWAQAGFWGLAGASSLVIGAAVATFARPPARLTAGVMAFGCGILISALAYDLILEGFEESGLWPVIGGAVVGSAAYTAANWLLAHRGAHHRKRSGSQQAAAGAGGLAIAIGSLLDGIPESVVLGLGLLEGGGVSLSILVAIFLSNLPEGLSSAAGMLNAGRSRGYVFGLWGGIALASSVAAALGALLLGGAPAWMAATVNAVAAGALLTMISETMIPEAVEGEQNGTGTLVVLGLLTAFALSQSGG